jgi:hypothetical protein
MEKNPLEVTEPVSTVNIQPALFIDTQANNVILDSSLNRIPAAVCRRLSEHSLVGSNSSMILLEKSNSDKSA